MKDILTELYYMLDITVKVEGGSPLIINRNESKLCKMLRGKQRKLFDAYEKAYSEYNIIIAEENFKRGFKLGMEFERELQNLF